MATRDDVYREFGRIAELAQLLETELGSALLAHDGIEGKLYREQDADAAKRLLTAIEKNTLGASLKAIRSRFPISPESDLDLVFGRALQVRNQLMHGFFLRHGMAIESDAGRDDMVRHILDLRPSLEQAYQLAGHLAQILFDAARLLKRVDET